MDDRSRNAPMGSKTIHGRTTQKIVSRQPDRFWTFSCFDDSRRLQTNLGLKLMPLEARRNYLPIHINSIQNGLRLLPGCRFWCKLLLDSEMDSRLMCIGPPPALDVPCWPSPTPSPSPCISWSSPRLLINTIIW